MRTRLLLSSLMLAMSTALVGCGSDSDPAPQTEDPGNPGPSDPPAPQLTTFNVSLSAPDALVAMQRTKRLAPGFADALLSKAWAVDASDIPAEGIALVVVDSNGVVLERVTLTEENLSYNEDNGTWEISIDGDPRLDCIVLFDLDGEITVEVGQPVPDDTLYAPTTSLDVDVDLASTAAYQQLLSSIAEDLSFEDVGIDPTDPDAVAELEQVINELQEQFDELVTEGNINLDGYSDVAELLAAVETIVEEVVESGLADLAGESAATLAAEFAEGGTGVTWFESWSWEDGYGYELEMEYGRLTPVTDAFYELDAESMAWSEAMSYDSSADADGNLVLTDTGWQQMADYWAFVGVNDDGSLGFSDAKESVGYRLFADISVTLAGRDLKEFLSVRSETAILSALLKEGVSFADGDLAFKVSDERLAYGYELFTYDDGLATAWRYGEQGALSAVPSLSDIPAATAGEGPEGGLWLNTDYGSKWGNHFVAKLVDDEAKTVNFYLIDQQAGTTTMAGSGSWSYQTHAGLGEGGQLIQFAIPQAVSDQLTESPEYATVIVANYQDGDSAGAFMGAMMDAGSGDEDTWVFNHSAGQKIVDAVEFAYLDQFSFGSANACELESDYSDDAYDGLGGPVELPYTDRAFYRMVSLCQKRSDTDKPFTTELISGKSATLFEDESVTFNADGTTLWEGEDESVTGAWEITDEGHLKMTIGPIEIAGNSGETYTLTDEEILVIVASEGNSLDVRGFYRNSLWAEMGPDGEGEGLQSFQGEIYRAVLTIEE
ncbi:hypothetical protein [Ferrimonas sp. YFM]|uniref:hypothetical protein n=1 Tax=Ferrimonas sp. YFM TaxID=3028878 RepID=UPI0025726167|nr:hypothetical protein [Ferrimonas sp. YFM]BDY04626.1 hypothetical protein F0521_16670 [Ferrimonas sp. YFM]